MQGFIQALYSAFLLMTLEALTKQILQFVQSGSCSRCFFCQKTHPPIVLAKSEAQNILPILQQSALCMSVGKAIRAIISSLAESFDSIFSTISFLRSFENSVYE